MGHHVQFGLLTTLPRSLISGLSTAVQKEREDPVMKCCKRSGTCTIQTCPLYLDSDEVVVQRVEMEHLEEKSS